MSKIGLYVVDATVDNSTVSNAANLTWHRKALYYDGKLVDKTVQETNNAGLYVKDNKLMLDGNSIARSDEAASMSVTDETVKFGDNIVASNNICVNITLQDYNNLRAGKFVEGYANYSEDTVYFIVTEDRLDEVIEYDENLVKGHKDIIYNSFIPKNIVGGVNLGGVTDLHVSETATSLITAKNFTDPRNVPNCVPREFNVFPVDLGEGGTLSFYYYVDTAYYDGSCPKTEDNGETYSGVGYYDTQSNQNVIHTFTTIVENEYGEEIFRRTTYSGEFKAECKLIRVNSGATNGNHITGRTWFSIRTIDEEGRESVSLYYDVYVKVPLTTAQYNALNALAPGRVDTEGKYIMCKQDLADYKFITNSDGSAIDNINEAEDIDVDNDLGVFTFAKAGDDCSHQANDRRYIYTNIKKGVITEHSCNHSKNNITDNPEYRTQPVSKYRTEIYKSYVGDKRSNYFGGYRNKIALERLMWEKKLQGYTGIVLYNSNNSENKNLDDDTNTVYLIDCHHIDTTKRLVTGIDAWATANGYSEVCDYHEELSSGGTSFSNLFGETAINPADYPNSVFSIPRTLYIVKAVKNESTNNEWWLTVPKDGRRITRSGGSYVMSAQDKADCEITEVINNNVRYANYWLGVNKQMRSELHDGETLTDWVASDGARIRRSKTDSDKVIVSWDANLKEDEEYCGKPDMTKPGLRIILPAYLDSILTKDYLDDYPYFYIGTKVEQTRPRRIWIPDDFTLDLNGCTILSTFGHDFHKEGNFKPVVLPLDANVNTHIQNGKVVGFFGLDMVKEAKLYDMSTISDNAEWEGAPTITMVGAKCCSIKNLQIENSAAYDTLQGYVVRISPGPKDTSTGSGYTSGNTIIANSESSVEHDATALSNVLSYMTIGYIDNGSLITTGAELSGLLDSGSQDNPDGNNNICLATTTNFVSTSFSGGGYCRRGFDLSYLHYMPTDRLFIRSSTDINYTIGKFNSYFIHCYKKITEGQTSSYEFIRTIKCANHTTFGVPKGTTHIKISTYAVSSNGQLLTTEKANSTRTSFTTRIKGMTNTSIMPVSISCSNLIDSCKYIRSKAAMINGAGINIVMKNVEVIGAVVCFGNSDWYTYTNAALHFEENKGMTNHLIIKDCKCFDDTFFGAGKRQLNVGNSRYIDMERCSGFSMSGYINNFLFNHNKFKGPAIYSSRNVFNNVVGIFKNNTGDTRTDGTDGNQLNQLVGERPQSNLPYNMDNNYCEDEVTMEVFVEDCLTNINPQYIHPQYMYSRTYRNKSNFYGEKVNSLVEQHEINI